MRRTATIWTAGLLVLRLGAAVAAPAEDDLVQRRAIRGAPVEGVHESDELRSMREFDESSFPRPLPVGDLLDRAPDDLATHPSADVHPAEGGLGPDALPASLRSPVPQPETVPTSIPWLASLKLPDMPVRLDPRVVRYLEFYKSDPKGRNIMTSWLRRQGRYRALMEAALDKAHLPKALLYVSMIESSYDPHDRSHAGAVGLWQFLPEGARIYGLRVDHWVDERKDPEKATLAVMRYLGDLKARFGTWSLALAGFNAGYGALLRSIHKYNTNDYWELCRHENGMPWETTLYVPKVMATAIVGENRALFGYDDVQADPALMWDRVFVDSSMSTAAIASAAGVSEAQIVTLNPHLRRGRTPPEARFEVHVPRGTAHAFLAGYDRSKEAVRPYTMRYGERLEDLAASLSMSTRQLKALNGLADTTEVRPGLTLVVPSNKEPKVPTACDTVVVAVPDKDLVVAGKKRVFYRTLPTDSLADLAHFFDLRSSDVQRWNDIDPDAKLAGAMVLQLWVDGNFDASKAALVDPTRVRVVTVGSDEFFDLEETKRGRARLSYTVKSGDDLQRIGKKFGLTVADMERINRFGEKHAPLVVGQKLVVYRTMSASEKTKAMCRLTPGGTDAAPADEARDEEEEAPEPALRETSKEPGEDPSLPHPPRP